MNVVLVFVFALLFISKGALQLEDWSFFIKVFLILDTVRFLNDIKQNDIQQAENTKNRECLHCSRETLIVRTTLALKNNIMQLSCLKLTAQKSF